MNRFIRIGAVLLILTLLQFIIPRSPWFGGILVILQLVFMIALILICDGLTQRLQNRSLIRLFLHDRKQAFTFAALAVSGSIIFELVAQWLGKLWIFPYFTQISYALLFAPGYIFYWLMVTESYLAVKAVFGSIIRHRVTHRVVNDPRTLAVGISGAVLFGASVILMSVNIARYGIPLFTDVYAVMFPVNFPFTIVSFLGIWLWTEYVSCIRRRSSLLQSLMRRNIIPLASILTVAAGLALFMESMNTPIDFWLYTNWPYQTYSLFGIPILVFAAWPLQYIGFLSWYGALADTDSASNLLFGD